MNRIYTYIILVILSTGMCFSQQLINTASAQQNNVSWSIGEIFTETGTTNDMIVSPGFSYQTSAIISATPEVMSRKINFYPNPVVDKMRVELDNSTPYTWMITDLVGRVLKNKVSCIDTEIDMSEFETGQYILKVVSGNYSHAVVIIKE